MIQYQPSINKLVIDARFKYMNPVSSPKGLSKTSKGQIRYLMKCCHQLNKNKDQQEIRVNVRIKDYIKYRFCNKPV